MAHEVFISYAVEDVQVAEKVCRALEEQSVRCWMAPRDVPFGADYEDAIVDAISTSPLLVLVLSEYSNASPHVKREIQNACAEGSPTRILPLRISEVPYSKALRYYLGSAQWLDASEPPLEAHLPRLVEKVRAQLPQPSPTADATPREQTPGPVRLEPAEVEELRARTAEIRESLKAERRTPPDRTEAGGPDFVVTHWLAGGGRSKRGLWIAAGVGALLLVAVVVFAISSLSTGGGVNNVNNVSTPVNANNNAAASPTAVNTNHAANANQTPAPNTNGNVTAASNQNRSPNLNLRPGGRLVNANRELRGDVIRSLNTSPSMPAHPTPTPTPR
ncbi:MAG TPA: toll/interleukin-1 receptor domain-containing protein [Pyrinomonadaceae bacterium]|nr:toll/interleukin-1 receptor domain-containing protein [Pyrinomonadaceae bacterium]